MKENIQNQGQQKTAKNLKKVQNLKVAVATALGLTAGTGVVIAADQLLNNEDVVADPAVEKEEVAAAAKPEPKSEPQTEITSEPKTEITSEPKTESTSDPVAGISKEPTQPEEIPAFAVLERETYTDEEGNDVEVAYGVTEGGHVCVVIDDGKTGVADLFWEDKNDDLDFQEEEVIPLAENGIEMNMADLIDFSENEEIAEPEPGTDFVAETDVVIAEDDTEDVDAEDAEDDTVGFAEMVDDPVVVDEPDAVSDLFDQVADVVEPEESESFEPVIEEPLMAEDTPAVDENVADNDFLANL